MGEEGFYGSGLCILIQETVLCITYTFPITPATSKGNYPGLQDLFEKYHDQGLEVLAFPSNQVRAV